MLILASASPARRELLRAAGFDPIIMPVDLDEDQFKARISDPELLVRTLAEAKVEECLQLLSKQTDIPVNTGTHPCAVLAADTVVYFNGKIIGKPKDRSEAKAIITSLQGNTHVVWTGANTIHCPSLLKGGRAESQESYSSETVVDHTSVTFKSMSEQEIETYLDSGDWIGAAGAYRLKQSIAQFVEKVDGDEATVIGLPTSVIMQLS